MAGLVGLSGQLWPIRYKPLPDELLSSWLVRLAHGHGLKVQTFCNLLFGNQRQVWNRDIDRLGPDWLVQELSLRTGAPLATAWNTTLGIYEGVLYPKMLASGTLPWIQTLSMYHRTFTGYGLQFCPVCLKSDKVPHFRKAWRVAFHTVCATHHCMLHDRCQACGAAVAFHRRDMQKRSIPDSIAACHNCGFDLGDCESKPIATYDGEVASWHFQLCELVEGTHSTPSGFDLDDLAVMRQFGKLLTSMYSTITLREYACNVLAVQDMVLATGKLAFESRELSERHHLIQLIGWFMLNLEPALRGAWRAKAIRYNHMCKDFESAPAWYRAVVEEFSNWRNCVQRK